MLLLLLLLLLLLKVNFSVTISTVGLKQDFRNLRPLLEVLLGTIVGNASTILHLTSVNHYPVTV